MPYFLIEIVLSNGKSFREFRLVDGVELDVYYNWISVQTHKHFVGTLVSFDVTQMAEKSRVADYMRSRNLTKLISKTQR